MRKIIINSRSCVKTVETNHKNVNTAAVFFRRRELQPKAIRKWGRKPEEVYVSYITTN